MEFRTNSIVDVPSQLTILPLRNAVMFPNTIIPLTVGRKRTLKAIELSLQQDNNLIGVFAQKVGAIEDPMEKDLYDVGTLGRILKVIDMPGETKTVMVQGVSRIHMEQLVETEPALLAQISPMDEEAIEEDPHVQALMHSLKEMAQKAVELSDNLPTEAAQFIQDMESASGLSDLVASNLNLPIDKKIELLMDTDLRSRLRTVLEVLHKEVAMLEMSKKIQSDIKKEMDRGQREFYLRKQMEAIQKELGELSGEGSEADELRKKLEEAKMPEEAEKVTLKELDRLSKINQQSAEYGVIRTYVDWLLDVPWSVRTDDILDIQRAEQILNEDHYNLEKVKKRILEYLAVRKLKKDMKGPILCLVGPPGVGKTSLGKSVARALGRKFHRVSLGGIRDEAEIRGHRRTYVGALPGRIIQGVKRAGTHNPVFMLDEIDKLGSDWRGDPSSALLEVLDPEQNFMFSDHYLEVPFDLSEVLFIATANITDTIPGPLRDRMEIIEIPGYTQEDKLHIAKGFIVGQQISNHGLSPEQISFDDDALRKIIDDYTREAGVRNLQREVASVCRGVAKQIASDESKSLAITADNLRTYLGSEKFYSEIAERTAKCGVATGLAWTPVGGDILFIEATMMKGTGKLTLTGKLGDVMKESAQAALSYVRSQAVNFGIDESLFSERDLHVHVPAGAIPKDGPSAGVTLLTALVSLFTGRIVDHETAMTGEITLRGSVLPVGGIKEKILAAKRAGIHSIVLPDKNKKDIEDIPAEARADLTFHYINQIDQALEHALSKERGKGC
ncbi:MAG: endopeptidase La [Candidatus Alcyoniella australis]|nr:endopeptidase La [Candidatus Alcyoniella australis]